MVKKNPKIRKLDKKSKTKKFATTKKRQEPWEIRRLAALDEKIKIYSDWLQKNSLFKEVELKGE